MASMPGGASPASGHDTDTPGSFSKGKRKFSHTTDAQRESLLEWLELPGNFDLLTKPRAETPSNAINPSNANGKKPKKVDGYRALAQYMNREALTEWSAKTARSRFESFMSVYRKAKRQTPNELSPVHQRVDALFGPDGDREGRFRSESLGQRSEGSRSPFRVFQEVSARSLWSDETSSPPRRRARVETVDDAVSSPLQELTGTNEALVARNDQLLRVESQRLLVRQQELELKQSELRARQDENRHKLRAEVLTRLVEAGKSPAEVREYLAIMDPVDTPLRLKNN